MMFVDTEFSISILLQQIGAILAIGGAIMNCSPNRCYKFYGFGIWTISNSILLAWSVSIGAFWVSLTYSVFICTSVYGTWKHRKDTL